MPRRLGGAPSATDERAVGAGRGVQGRRRRMRHRNHRGAPAEAARRNWRASATGLPPDPAMGSPAVVPPIAASVPD
jgi:hypothetical protein